ncbi:MAG: hypothetical protein AAB211_01420 [Pseudomonadota bacterium]
MSENRVLRDRQTSEPYSVVKFTGVRGAFDCVVQAAAASDMLNVMSRTTTPMSTNPSLMKLLLSEDILHLNDKVEEIDSGLVCEFFGAGH